MRVNLKKKKREQFEIGIRTQEEIEMINASMYTQSERDSVDIKKLI